MPSLSIVVTGAVNGKIVSIMQIILSGKLISKDANQIGINGPRREYISVYFVDSRVLEITAPTPKDKTANKK